MIKSVTRLTILGVVLLTLTGCYQPAELQPLVPTQAGGASVAVNPTIDPILLTPTVDPNASPTIDPNLALTVTTDPNLALTVTTDPNLALSVTPDPNQLVTSTVSPDEAMTMTAIGAALFPGSTETLDPAIAIGLTNDAAMILTLTPDSAGFAPTITPGGPTVTPTFETLELSPVASFTPFPTFTPTFTETPTSTFTPTFTNTPTNTPTSTPTETPTITPTTEFTSTPTPSATLTATTTRIPSTLSPVTDGANGTIDDKCNYTVEQDDRLLRIALRFNRTLDELVRANPSIYNTQVIFIGQILKIPDCKTR